MEPMLMIIGSVLLAVGLSGGWFCYSKVSPEKVEQASYVVVHGLMPSNSLWLIGAILGLLLMVSGMVLIFASLVGVQVIQAWIAWYQDIFG